MDPPVGWPGLTTRHGLGSGPAIAAIPGAQHRNRPPVAGLAEAAQRSGTA
jgi:hypothetical protein